MSTYSDVSNIDLHLEEVSFHKVKEGQAIFVNGKWYKALEDAHVENGMVGFRAEDEEFKEIVIEHSKNDMAYAPRLFTERG